MMNERITKYLPPFVSLKGIAIPLINSIAATLDSLQIAIDGLKDVIYSGKSLKKILDEYKIFYKNTDIDEALKDKLSNWEDICCNRGTTKGIIYDLSCFDEVGNTVIKGMGEAGEIVGDINSIGDPADCLGIFKLIAIYPKEDRVIEDKTKEIIKQYIVPIEINPIFME